MSRLIKGVPPLVNQVSNDKKVISIKVFKPELIEDDFEPSPIRIDEHAQSIIANAEKTAEDIIMGARQEAEVFRQHLDKERQAFELEKERMAAEAHESGFASGYKEGQQKGYLEYHNVIQSAQSIVNSAKIDYREHVESSEREILEIGIKVAQKILGKTIEKNEEEFLSIVKGALKEARENQEVQLHVNPAHFEFILANKADLKMLFPKEVDIFVYPDDQLTESSCVIESVNGRIDASIDSQLEEIKRKLIELLEGEQK